MRSNNKLIYILTFLPIIIVVWLIFPENSYAWGPGLHIKLGLDIIDSVHKIAPALSEIIAKYPYHYLYGGISPDIIIGKKFASEIDHCHNWEVGLGILKESESESERAFAYGYLCHLAADSVAHNYFIPNQIIASFVARTLDHTYWEMRYDGLLGDEIWEVFKKIPRDVRRECNKRLKRILTTTIFSFGTNRSIFTGLMHINRITTWQEMIRTVSGKSQWILTKKDVKNYYKLAFNSQSDLLLNREAALCMHADPNGKDSLKVAKKIRKDLRVLYKRGALADRDVKKILEDLKPHFIKKMTTRDKVNHTIKVGGRRKSDWEKVIS